MGSLALAPLEIESDPSVRIKALKRFLRKNLEYDRYQKHFTDELTTILQDNLAEDQAEDFAQTLANQCAKNGPDAVDKVNEILDSISLDMDIVVDGARAAKAEELAQDYVRRKPRAIKLIRQLLAKASVSIETLTVKALALELDYIERMDRLTTIAEGRRNASLREIDRRRPALGERLRQSVQDVEDSEFEVIETAPEGKTVA